MRLEHKLTMLYLKYLPVIMLWTCIMKIILLHLNQPITVKHINVVLNIFIATGLYAVSYSFQFCSLYRNLLFLALFGYINYEVYLFFQIGHDNIISNVYLGLYIVISFIYSLYCIYKIHNRNESIQSKRI